MSDVYESEPSNGCFEYCAICGSHTLESWVGLDGLCRYCRNEEAMEDEFDYLEEQIERGKKE